jgi:hypothetical protein
MADDRDLYLEPKPHLTRQRRIVLGVAGLMLFGVVGLVVALRARHFLPIPATEAGPTMTLVPTFTPRPTATAMPPVVTLSVRPWTDDGAPLGMVEVTLSLPAAAQVSHVPPSGFHYWCGDLLQTHEGWGWSGASGGEVRWYLLREPELTLPVTLEVTVSSHRKGGGAPRVLTVTLQPATPATTSVPLE